MRPKGAGPQDRRRGSCPTCIPAPTVGKLRPMIQPRHRAMRPARLRQSGLAIAAGLLALLLQLLVPVLPQGAMDRAMDVAATSPAEAVAFAGTCLGFAAPQKGKPVGSDQHQSCPICFTLAQAQGFAASAIDLVEETGWVLERRNTLALAAIGISGIAGAFDSQAPPALAAA